MAKASTHIAPGNAGYFSHNSRQSFSQSQVFFDEANEISCTKEEAFKRYRSLLAERSDAYRERTGQTLQKKTVTHLSAVVNLEQHHTLEDLAPLVSYIEEELDTKVIQLAIHRDEGKLVNKEDGKVLTSGEQFFCDPASKKLYFDKEFQEEIDMSQWEMEKNYHAHIEFMGLASDGKSIKRELTTWFFRKLQDKTAEVLKMERGEKTEPSYTKEQMQKIKAKLKPKKEYENDKAYGAAFTAAAKELGYWKPRPKRKRKDTHEYKAQKAKENELNAKALAKQKELKAQIAELRAKLQTQKADRSQYAALEQLNKELKERIRQKELLTEELQAEIEKFKAEIKSLKKLAYTTEEHWVEGDDIRIVTVPYRELYARATSKSVRDYQEHLENRADELESKSNRLEEKLRIKGFELGWKDSEIEELKKKNTALKEQNTALKADLDTFLSIGTAQELKTLKTEYEKLDNEYWELLEIAYDGNYPETVYDEYGIIPYDKIFTFKERYEQSSEELAALREKIDEKDEIINELNEGYEQIEKALFGDNRDRPVEEIAEEATTLSKILTHVSKYLNLGIEKLKDLFKDKVPDKTDVILSQDHSMSKSSPAPSPGGGMRP